ncbi:HD domain-containing phosphohydrolase [Magnetovibrio blakemorei]|uniref:Two-component system response regulator n=1 Tax=Magnetovibrio blakemorei TaxID=28181 RepID=A0A1E5QAR9_9PROT|nr:HD domain-containing phosphohydrolase [Magnetovibrio blakemorei]OEJ68996.1 two-component system response regulator [Magnetovibrio blakemorei]
MPDVDTYIRNARILVVDDNFTNVTLLTNLLEAEGYVHVIGVTDPREAVALYQAEPFDLVLLDIRMPHMNGYEVIQTLKSMANGNIAPIMVLTAQTDMDTKLKALEAGAQDFLHKPFERVEALIRIRNMLEVRLLHNQVRQQNEDLEHKVQERTHELEETRLEVVRRLGRAAEYKDNETGMHVVRMSKIAELLGRAIGMSEEDVKLLLHASPMHDIGKIGIPDSVLLKPGKLDPAEWEVMKTHAQIGIEILGDHVSPLMQMARMVAYSHHEKWDGSGYPRALKGDAIPLVGRITAVADVFDALTSERPYKKAWIIEDAAQFIKDQSGIHFDPAIVEQFCKHFEAIAAISKSYRDTFEVND